MRVRRDELYIIRILCQIRKYIFYILYFECFIERLKKYIEESWTGPKIELIGMTRDVIILDIVFKIILTLIVLCSLSPNEIPFPNFEIFSWNIKNIFPCCVLGPGHSSVIEPLSPSQLSPFIGPQWTSSWYLYNFDNNEMCCPLSLIRITVPRQIEHCVKYFQTNAPREFN